MLVGSFQFDAKKSVYDATELIREKVPDARQGQGEFWLAFVSVVWCDICVRVLATEYGLFLPDDDPTKGRWLEQGRTLEYYHLTDGVSVQNCCRRRSPLERCVCLRAHRTRWSTRPSSGCYDSRSIHLQVVSVLWLRGIGEGKAKELNLFVKMPSVSLKIHIVKTNNTKTFKVEVPHMRAKAEDWL